MAASAALTTLFLPGRTLRRSNLNFTRAAYLLRRELVFTSQHDRLYISPERNARSIRPCIGHPNYKGIPDTHLCWRWRARCALPLWAPLPVPSAASDHRPNPECAHLQHQYPGKPSLPSRQTSWMYQHHFNQIYTCPGGPRANSLYHGNSFQSNVRTSHRPNTFRMSPLI